MADANLLLPPDYIHRLLAVDAPEVGLVTSPPIGTEAQGVWGEVEAAFLNGREEPFVETADADFNVLGVQMRCYYDYGVAFAEWRAAVYSTGA
jgi:hypothetical protein